MTVPSLSTIAETALAWGLTYTLHSTLLLAAALLAVPALIRRAPRLAEMALRAALLGSLVTASVQVGLGYEPLAGRVRLETRAAAPIVAEVAARSLLPAASATDWVAAPAAPMASPARLAPTEPTAAPLSAPLRGWPVALLTLWAAGALFLAGTAVRSYRRVLSRVRYRAQVVGGSILESLKRLAGTAAVPRLTCSTRLPVPVAFRARRGNEIALPPRALFSLSDEQQEGLLAHELAHLVRRDPQWLLAGRLLSSLLFFQPLNWLAAARLRELSELLADEWAVKRTGRPLSLARCLTEVAGWSLGPALPVPGMAAGRPSQLGERIRRLVAERRTAHRAGRTLWMAGGSLAVLLAVAAFAPGVAVSAPPAPPAPPAAAAPEAPPPPPAMEEVDLPEAPEAPEAVVAPEAPPPPPAPPRHRHAMAPLAGLSPEKSARLKALEGRMNALGERMGKAAGQGGELGRMGAEMGRLAAEMAAIVTPAVEEELARHGEELERLGAEHEKLGKEFGKEFGETFGREFGEKFGKDMGDAFGPEFAERWRRFGESFAHGMEGPDAQKLRAEIDRMTQRMKPSRAELDRLRAEARRLAKDHQLSEAERRRIADQARQLAAAMRPSEEELRAIRELARKQGDLARRAVEEHRPEIDEARRMARRYADDARREADRQLGQERLRHRAARDQAHRAPRARPARPAAPDLPAPPAPPAPPTDAPAPPAPAPPAPPHGTF